MTNSKTTMLNRTINSIVAMLREYNKLDKQYGHLSCLQFPAKYDRMETLQAELIRRVETLTKNTDILPQNMTTALENIAADIDNGNLSESVKLTLYTQGDFIDYLASSMTRKESDRFKDMIGWMQPIDRAGYLQARFILEFENDRNEKRSFYHDDWMSFVIVAS